MEVDGGRETRSSALTEVLGTEAMPRRRTLLLLPFVKVSGHRKVYSYFTFSSVLTMRFIRTTRGTPLVI